MLILNSHFGGFILTLTLLPLLFRTSEIPGSDVRIITISSEMGKFISPTAPKSLADFNKSQTSGNSTSDADLDSFINKQKRYAFTKVLNAAFATELQRRLLSSYLYSGYVDQDADGKRKEKGSPIISLSLHPGLVATQGGLDLFPTWLHPILNLIGKTPLQGSKAALFASSALEVRTSSSRFSPKAVLKSLAEEKGGKEGLKVNKNAQGKGGDDRGYYGVYLMPDAKIGVPTEQCVNELWAKDAWEGTVGALKEVLGESWVPEL
jgi:NAD(P)-dependent dehydrogenase (short-subunit alcohol dehydrogenase family)